MNVLDAAATGKPQLTTQQIASAAAVPRSGLYRFFNDRADLDTAIQRGICQHLKAELLASVTLTGTPRHIVHRIITTYVSWVTNHPAWASFIEHNQTTNAPAPIDEMTTQLAEQIEVVATSFLALVHADIRSEDRQLMQPWVSSLISGCLGAVRTWRLQEEPKPSHERLATFQADTTWMQITGLAAASHITMPQVPVEDLLHRAADRIG